MADFTSNIENCCLNCGNEIIENFCGHCGQKKYSPSDKKFSHLIEETSHSLTHFDGTFWTNLKTILLHPGKLSQDYCSGRKKKYYKPIAFFAILVILYLLFPVFEGLNMRLKYFRVNGLFQNYYNATINQIMISRDISFDELSEKFHHLGEKTAKFLIITIIPVMALFSKVLAFRRRKYYYDHFIFATEILSVFILVFYLLLGFIVIISNYFDASLVFLSDLVLTISSLLGFWIFITIASRRFFHYKLWRALSFAFLYTIFYFFYYQFIYKFFLFYIVMKFI